MTAHRCTVCGGDLDTGARCHNPACRPPVTAPAARTLAEIVAEGRRLEAERKASSSDYSAQVATEGTLIDFLLENYGRLLAVAEAAVRYTDALDDYDNTDDGDFVQQRALLTQTEVALRAAVWGEEPK